jgi:endonuclease G, mitochondrial
MSGGDEWQRRMREAVAPYGLPSDENVLVRGGFVVSYNPRTRCANWTAQRLRRIEYAASRGSGGSQALRTAFVEEEHERFAARLADYARSGYDRGHLVPVGDVAAAHPALDVPATFRLSSISPQVGVGFNRHYWARFEHFVRSLARHWYVWRSVHIDCCC